MYSVVLMAALTAGGTQAPAFGHGCGGCWSSCWGCSGGCWGSCYGCYGCYGGWGSCYGGCYSYWGSFYGSGYGSGYGYGCCGCWGSGYACYGGCYGGGCYGGAAYPVDGGMGVPVETGPVTTPSDQKKSGTGTKSGSSAVPAPAKLIVELPSEAKLYIDDRPMRTPSSRRTFTTPELQPGQSYYYIVRAELVRDGKSFSDTKRVIVRPGEEVTASFRDLGTENTARADAGKQ
jgi:uncharacterized protein (TIGR03000 family)